MQVSYTGPTKKIPHTRVIWGGDRKNSIRATVTRLDRGVWRVDMSDRYVFGVSVTSRTVQDAWYRALNAVLENLNARTVS